MQRIYEGVDFCPDMDSVNPNIMGTAHQVVVVIEVPDTSEPRRPRRQLTIEEAQRVVDVARFNADAVSPNLIEQAQQILGTPAIATTVDIAAYEA
jgi:hypothetical protein